MLGGVTERRVLWGEGWRRRMNECVCSSATDFSAFQIRKFLEIYDGVGMWAGAHQMRNSLEMLDLVLCFVCYLQCACAVFSYTVMLSL